MAIVSSDAGAVFSSCRRWRYLLWRRWDPARPPANFLMLNPSTADELKLDPSCTRARVYAERYGIGVPEWWSSGLPSMGAVHGPDYNCGD